MRPTYSLSQECKVTKSQLTLSMEFSRPEYWSGLAFPAPGGLPNPGTEPRSPATLPHCRLVLYCWATGEAPINYRKSLKEKLHKINSINARLNCVWCVFNNKASVSLKPYTLPYSGWTCFQMFYLCNRRTPFPLKSVQVYANTFYGNPNGRRFSKPDTSHPRGPTAGVAHESKNLRPPRLGWAWLVSRFHSGLPWDFNLWDLILACF